MPHIEVRNVSLVYDTPAGEVPGVAGVSFDIEASEFLCIVGPSGCGKSTLLNVIAGFLAPTAGEIRIGGKAVSGHGPDRGVVFQDFAQLFPWRTALGLADPPHLEPEGHVSERGAPWEQLGKVLKHHAAVGAVTADGFAADADFACGGGEKAGDDVEQRRLTAAGGADDAQEFRGLDVEADARDARDLPGGRVVDERDVADFDMGHDLRAAVIDGMRLCGQTRAIPPGRVSPG